MTVLTKERISIFDTGLDIGYQYRSNIVTLSDYWEFYYEHPDYNYEYNNGILEVKPVAKKIDVEMFTWFFELSRRYLEVYPIAWLSLLEIGFKMQQLLKIQVRKPDLAVVLHSNPIPFEDNDRKYHGTFDMCVEMVSDSSSKEIKRDTETKFKEYEAAGVKEYWLLSYDKNILEFYRLNKWGRYKKVKTKNGVWESKVLPGFRLRVDDLFKTPPLSELVDDPVYADFVFPKYRQAKLEAEQRADTAEQRADTAEQRAELERQAKLEAEQRAEQERLAKEKLAKFLREQGFNPDELL
jgi:Uma2 family endonuclease